MARVRVLLADDHPVLLAGLKNLLADEFELVGAVSDGKALVAAARKLQPDIIVTDISMPELGGIDAIRQLRLSLPAIRAVVLSVHNDSAYVDEAFQAGARGYVVKQCAAEELLNALRLVSSGRTYVAAGLRRGDDKRLTARQLQVLRLIAEGLQNKEIAQRLTVTVKTVEYHRARIMEQLDIHTAAGLTRYAITRGLLTSQPSN